MDQFQLLNSLLKNHYLYFNLSFLELRLNYLQFTRKFLVVIQMVIFVFDQFFNIWKIYLNTKVIYEIDNFCTSYTKLCHPSYLK